MIDSITIGNFKAFGDAQKLPLKPITLVFGANSSGKSSILHSLLLANEIVTQEETNFDVHYTHIGGGSVDLGGFRQYVNKRDTSKNVMFGFDIIPGDLSNSLAYLFEEFNKITIITEFGSIKKYNDEKYDETNHKSFKEFLKLLSYEIKADEISILKMSRKGEKLTLDYVNTDNRFTENIFEAVRMFTTSGRIIEHDQKTLSEALTTLIPRLHFEEKGLLPECILELEKFRDPRNEILPAQKDNRNEVLSNVLTNLFPFILNDLLKNLAGIINMNIKNISYLGPLRSYPERHFNLSKMKDTNWNAGGGFAWKVVAKDKKIRDKVNEWLGREKLKQKYEIRIMSLIEESKMTNRLPELLNERYYDLLKNIVAEDSQFNEIVIQSNIIAEELNLKEGGENTDTGVSETLKEWIAANSNIGTDAGDITKNLIASDEDIMKDVVLFDRSTNTYVSHRDVGIGISQVLPVLVSAIENKSKIITIEQPEIHLHPALQAELGDLFIDSALGENKNTFILETHSEHLILRILRRVRETADGTLKEGLTKIRPEDVQVVYVEPKDKGSVIVNLEVNEEGDFNDRWPNGFFDERAEELF